MCDGSRPCPEAEDIVVRCPDDGHLYRFRASEYANEAELVHVVATCGYTAATIRRLTEHFFGLSAAGPAFNIGDRIRITDAAAYNSALSASQGEPLPRPIRDGDLGTIEEHPNGIPDVNLDGIGFITYEPAWIGPAA